MIIELKTLEHPIYGKILTNEFISESIFLIIASESLSFLSKSRENNQNYKNISKVGREIIFEDSMEKGITLIIRKCRKGGSNDVIGNNLIV